MLGFLNPPTNSSMGGWEDSKRLWQVRCCNGVNTNLCDRLWSIQDGCFRPKRSVGETCPNLRGLCAWAVLYPVGVTGLFKNSFSQGARETHTSFPLYFKYFPLDVPILEGPIYWFPPLDKLLPCLIIKFLKLTK